MTPTLPHWAEALKGFGGYSTTATIIVFGLLAWWKVLPAFIDAISNRQSKIEERMGKLLEDATARFQREIAAADERHHDCMEGQRLMALEVDRLRDCVNDQQATIEGLKRQIIQMQTSALRVDGQGVTPIITAALQSLDKVKGAGE